MSFAHFGFARLTFSGSPPLVWIGGKPWDEVFRIPGIRSTSSQGLLRNPQTGEKLGIAPFSSMWCSADAHDSDGLLMTDANGEWLWRPFQKQTRVNVSHFRMDGVKGFGLMQRDRDASHYRDKPTQYEQRRSVWVTPKSKWDAGAVELLEVPSDVAIISVPA
jgi:periplasmic glucans biosynthesis protein